MFIIIIIIAIENIKTFNRLIIIKILITLTIIIIIFITIIVIITSVMTVTTIPMISLLLGLLHIHGIPWIGVGKALD